MSYHCHYHVFSLSSSLVYRYISLIFTMISSSVSPLYQCHIKCHCHYHVFNCSSSLLYRYISFLFIVISLSVSPLYQLRLSLSRFYFMATIVIITLQIYCSSFHYNIIISITAISLSYSDNATGHYHNFILGQPFYYLSSLLYRYTVIRTISAISASYHHLYQRDIIIISVP